MMEWQTLRQNKGQIVQSFTEEFRKKSLALNIPLDSYETLMKYISALHIYLRHTLLLFNPTSLDKFLCKLCTLNAKERMFNKIPQRSLPSSHTISLKESLKERTNVLPLQRREKEIHIKLVARGMVTTMSSVGDCIRRKDESNSVERGRQRPLLQYNKILVLI
jgi:hypothetical protein